MSGKGRSVLSLVPTRYSLTPEGLELAQKLAESEDLSSLNVGIGLEKPELPGPFSAEL